MFVKPLSTFLIAALMATAFSAPAKADNLGAAIVGGVLGGIIVNEAHKNKKRTSSSGYSATRSYNRETQQSLNYFGFNAGSPDGVMGQRSRTAIAQYQGYTGFPPTGKLTQYERDFLVSSFNRAQIGGTQVVKAMQTSPDGARSLLVVWRDEATGGSGSTTTYAGMPAEVSEAIDEVAASSDPSAEQLLQRSGFIQLADLNGDGKTDYILDTSVSGSSFWCGAQDCTVMVFASTPQGFVRSDFLSHEAQPALFSCHQGTCRMDEKSVAPQMAVTPAPAPAPAPEQGGTVMASAQAATPETGQGGIQLFETGTSEKPGASLASMCTKVSLLTNSNGGFVTVANLNDPSLALSEQFCLARTYAIGNGEQVAERLSGVTTAQVDQQCDGFGPVLSPFVAMLSQSPADKVASEMQSFVLKSNMSIDQLLATANICLFSGYRRDDMDVALGSALLMVGAGQKPYAELIGHHLAEGYGVAQNSDKARAWYMMAIEAVENGAEPVFAPGQPERTSLLRAAVTAEDSQAISPQPAAVLPTFNLAD